MKLIFSIAIMLTASCSFAQDTTKTYIISFRSNKTELTKADKLILDSVAGTMKKWPVNCIIISGNYGENEKRLLNVYDRARTIVVYLVANQGVNSNHIRYSQNTSRTDDRFEISFTGEDYNTAPEPHPNLRKKQNN